MNYYPHHIGDYRSDTAHLSLLEHGVYRQLLDTYYLSEQPIPEETEAVCRRLSARTAEEKKAVEYVLNEFFYCADGWHQRKCDKVIAEYNKKADQARQAGKLGGRPKKTGTVIFDNQEESERKANQEPRTNNHKPITKEPSQKQAIAKAQSFDPLEIVFPEIDGLNAKWPLWIAYRREQKLSVGKACLQAQSEFLRAMHQKGHDPTEILETSMRNAWQGIFEPKNEGVKNYGQGGQQGITGYIPLGEARTRTIEALTGRKRGSTIEGDSTPIFANEHAVR